jgi:dCMP deaminase
MSLRWDKRFLQLALDYAHMSKDPSTRVGAIIVGPDRELRSAGFNGLPRNIVDLPSRLHNRETKLKLMVHGEMNAVLAAARVGIPLKGCTMYMAATNPLNEVWGGVPCTRCSVEIIQTGIVRIVSWSIKTAPSRWHDDLTFAKQLLLEAGIECVELARK